MIKINRPVFQLTNEEEKAFNVVNKAIQQFCAEYNCNNCPYVCDCPAKLLDNIKRSLGVYVEEG